MGLARRPAKRIESAISALILVVLVLIAAGIFVRQSNYDMSRLGIETAGIAEFTNQDSKFETPDILGGLMPAGFKSLSEMEVYGPENLYEKIDGKAPAYTEAGFQKLYTQRFASRDDPNLLGELYYFDMGAARNAFSVYSTQKRADARELADFEFACRTTNAVYIARGKYYVEMIGFSESEELIGAMVEIARAIRGSQVFEYSPSITETELSLFPSGTIPGSYKLYLSSTFGFEGLTNTFAARYKIGQETVTVFFSRNADWQEAKGVARSYYKFLIDNGGKAKPADSEAVKAIAGRVVDFYGDIEVVFATGKFVGGVHAAAEQADAERVAEALFEKLSEAAN